MLREGSIVDDKYKLLERIGSGGMGAVWRAEKLATFERFAIKFIHQHALGDESYCTRFGREVAVLRGLRHPNIVDVFDWSLPGPGRQPAAYVVMELLEGESLQEVLRRRGRLPAGLMVRVMLQVLDGVAAVHAQGIVHRDLSPANIFLVRTPNPIPRVKILDFGLAKGIGGSNSADSAVTQPGSVLGRAAYAAPEIFLDSDLDVRADIFACGMILFRALTGRFPYRETRVDLMWAERYSDRLKQDPYPAPSRFVSDVPAPVEKIVMRALRRRPGDRYASATEMQKELLWADGLLPAAQRNLALEVLGAHIGEAPAPSLAPAASLAAPAALPDARGRPAATLRGMPRERAAREVPARPAAAIATTGPVVFGTPTEAPTEATVMTRVPLERPPTSAPAAELPAQADAASPSQPSSAVLLVGDVASTVGAPVRRSRGGAFRRPAVVAVTLVGIALAIAVVVLLARGGGSDAHPQAGGAQPAAGSASPATGDAATGKSATEEADALALPVPLVPAAPPRPAAPVEPDAGIPATNDASTPATAVAEQAADAATPDAPPPAAMIFAAEKVGGDAGPGTGDTDSAASTARVPGPAATAPRDAGTGTIAATRDAGGPADASRTPPRDAGTAVHLPDDFLTDYETPQAPRHDAGAAPPAGGNDFLTDYEGGRAP